MTRKNKKKVVLFFRFFLRKGCFGTVRYEPLRKRRGRRGRFHCVRARQLCAASTPRSLGPEAIWIGRTEGRGAADFVS